MSKWSFVKPDFSWLPVSKSENDIQTKSLRRVSDQNITKPISWPDASKINKARFTGIDVLIISGLDKQTLFSLIDHAVDWSPFELVDLVKVAHHGEVSSTSRVSEDEWLCRFKFSARYKDAKSLVSSLLDSIEYVVPWTLTEKIFEGDEEKRCLRTISSFAS